MNFATIHLVLHVECSLEYSLLFEIDNAAAVFSVCMVGRTKKI